MLEFLIGATLAAILTATALILSALDDIRQHLERIDEAQHAIAEELDMDEAGTIDYKTPTVVDWS